MDFRTAVKPDTSLRGLVRHGRTGSVVTIGSCFSDNIARRLRDDLFEVVSNPTGTLYNPLSIAAAVERIAYGTHFKREELFLTPSGRWCTLWHHSSFAGDDPDMTLEAMNRSLDNAKSALSEASVLFVTLGSAYVYSMGDSVVANCHKLRPSVFVRRLLDVGEVAGALRSIAAVTPAKVICTVSPVRHLADGLHGNNLSKATLMLGIEKSGLDYFEAYEAICDDLRDYRFYADDMKHPSGVAADYVYDLFSECYFDDTTRKMLPACRSFSRLLAHRPADADAHVCRIAEVRDSLLARYPVLADAVNKLTQSDGLFNK